MTRMPVFFDPLYTDGLSDAARFPKHRYQLTRAELDRRRAPVEVVRAPAARRRDARWAHGPGYVDAFLEARLPPKQARRVGLLPWTDAIRERTLRLLGGTLAAFEAVRAGAGIAANLGGGTHHAHRHYGAGYCVFNDLAVVAKAALGLRFAERVLVLDLDVHQGDGTATILADEPRATTVSVHCRANFPFRKARSNVDIALAPGTGDAAYGSLLEQRLDGWLDRYRPDLVVYQAGVDGLASDRLGRLALTRRGLRARNARVLDAVWVKRRVPLVVTMGGGYGRPIETSVPSLADIFEQSARVLAAHPPRAA